MTGDSQHPFEREHDEKDKTVQMLAKGTVVFSRYALVRVLGRGGMGVVWLARDNELDRDVALKFLPESVCHDKEAAAELKRETRRSLDLTHPNIVRTYDFVHDDKYAAIAMEYIDGKSLSALKTQRPTWCFEIREIAPYVQQLCAALDYAHSVGRVVHQDLKPANLMVNCKGQLKVTDFGIARSIADSVSRITAEDTVGGTLVYMSPQQLNGERPATSNDIYALGATIYDLVTSKPPFYTGSLHHQIEKNTPPLMAGRRKELEIRGDDIPAEWEKTIADCLAKRPEDRPATAAEIAHRLGLHQSKDPNWMTSLPGRTDANPNFKPLKVVHLTIAAVAFCLLLGLIYFAATRPGKINPSDGARASKAASTNATPVRVESLPRSTNGLGMIFVRLGEIRVSIWETRRQDFEAFTAATGYDATEHMQSRGPDGRFREYGLNWKNPGWDQRPDEPVVGVSYLDGISFCDWLTQVERKAGKISDKEAYRLPTDREWSVMANFARETGATPAGRDLRIRDIYPWGEVWPPPKGSGNFQVADDGQEFTAAVGSFNPNRYGLYDLAGNVWEWCLDAFDGTFDPEKPEATLRGGSFIMRQPDQLMTSRRRYPGRLVTDRHLEFGFRCVLGPVRTPPLKVEPMQERWTNELGMTFTRVGSLFFSIWETRVQDYKAFVRDTNHKSRGKSAVSGGVDWLGPGFAQDLTHPVVGVCREDSEAFCDWLTTRERNSGKLPQGYVFRLPTDREWSQAAGMKREPGDTPEDRNGKVPGFHPWGTIWPPPAGSGNFKLPGDAFEATSPVGSFPPNAFGLHDMGGNVWEWCEDVFGRFKASGVLRGGSYSDSGRIILSTAHRRDPDLSAPDRLDFAVGFRCVMAPENGGPFTGPE